MNKVNIKLTNDEIKKINKELYMVKAAKYTTGVFDKIKFNKLKHDLRTKLINK